MHLSFSSLKPLWSRLRLSRSFEPKPQARAGSRTAKPLTLNTIAAAAVSEDSLPFAEPKSPRGAPKGSTMPTFNVNPLGRKIEGDPKSGQSANKKGKGKNGGSNDTSPASARTTQLVPPDTGSHRGSRSRTSSVANTPTSSPQTSPETKKENLPRRSGVKAGSTDTENRERSGKQSTNTSSHTSPPKPSLQGKHEKVKPAALPTSDLPTPPASPETHNQTVPAAPEDGPAPSLLETTDGLADKTKQENDKPAALPTFDLPTPPASPETHNQAVPVVPEDGPAPSLLEITSGLADKTKQGDVKPAALLSSDPPSTPASQTVLADRPAPPLLVISGESPDKDT